MAQSPELCDVHRGEPDSAVVIALVIGMVVARRTDFVLVVGVVVGRHTYNHLCSLNK